MNLLLPFDQRSDDQQDLGYVSRRKLPGATPDSAAAPVHHQPESTLAELTDAPHANRSTSAHLLLTAHRRSDERPRYWSVEAKAASLFIAHALEYLSDSRNIPTGRHTAMNRQDDIGQALEILLQARRDIYLACPFIERRSKNRLKGLFLGVERRKDRQN
jgi:hypothetical protein